MSGLFEIFEPRYHDGVVLLDERKVIDGINVVNITKSKSWNGKYTIWGRDIKNCQLQSNGKIMCYAVPTDRLIRTEEKKEERKDRTARAKWIEQTITKCSCCGFTVEGACSYKFCPECGARMEGEE